MPEITRRDVTGLLALSLGALGGLLGPERALAGITSTRDAPSPSAPSVVNVIGREAWGARPPRGLFRPHVLERMTLHHTAGYAASVTGAARRFREYQARHQGRRGWPDIAYHYLIDLGGNVYEGRPTGVAGDTATAYDPAGHFLVCLDGDFDRQGPTEKQMDSLVAVLAWAAKTHGLDPSSISGHGDWAPTDCPGRRVRDRMGVITEQVVEVLATRRPSLRHLDPAASSANIAHITGSSDSREAL